ncbi:MAG: TetR/AcrR family transcriptional regulator [Chloroflexi bacterium]|nr:TetR/AcrR family transcriptional regulator [Chloroflexota bacterium]MCC6895101.1 TetR/AcrR family transcriptional regulator [Anaerolineae bacterium]
MKTEHVHPEDMMTDDHSTLTPKAQETRQRIFDTAVKLFMEKGYEETTMREIAAEAECSLGLAYRYFESKEVVVIQLYRQLAANTKERIAALPELSIAERFYHVMNEVMQEISPFRPVWQGIFGGALNPNSPYGVLGDRTADIRREMKGVFMQLVTEADDAPKKPEQVAAMGMLLYVAYLMTLLFWISDRSAGYKTTYQLLDFSRDTLNLIRGAMVLPPVTKGMMRLAGIVEQVFGG